MRSYLLCLLAAVLATLSVSTVQAAEMNHTMHHDMSQHAAMQAPVYHSQGIIKKVTPQAVSISHQAIPDLNWPPMTMQFALPQGVDLPELQVGQKVDFTFSQHERGYQIVSLTPQH